LNRHFAIILMLWAGMSGSAMAQGPDFAAVDATLRQAHTAAGADFAMGLVVRDREDRLVYASNLGGFDPSRRLPVASASKIVAATVMMVLVDRGLMTLDSTTGQVLGWQGDKGRITLRQLLAQVSGLKPNVPCLNDVRTTLAACVDTLSDDAKALQHPPGSFFDYGGSHFQVAARMAEVAAGKPWAELFNEILGRPLGLAAETNFTTSPWLGPARAGTANPRAGGGLAASLDDFMKLLSVPFHQGVVGGRRYARAALFEEMGSEPNPEAAIGASPLARATGMPFRYGLGTWLECVPAQRPCPVQSSPGAFGWTPWFDRGSGYYAVLAMARPPAAPAGEGGTAGVVDFAVQLQQRLKPLIAQALQRNAGPASGSTPTGPPR